MTEDRVNNQAEVDKCTNSACPKPNFEAGFGLAGGGYGPYEYCPVCNLLVSKLFLPDGED